MPVRIVNRCSLLDWCRSNVLPKPLVDLDASRFLPQVGERIGCLRVTDEGDAVCDVVAKVIGNPLQEEATPDVIESIKPCPFHAHEEVVGGRDCLPPVAHVHGAEGKPHTRRDHLSRGTQDHGDGPSFVDERSRAVQVRILCPQAVVQENGQMSLISIGNSTGLFATNRSKPPILSKGSQVDIEEGVPAVCNGETIVVHGDDVFTSSLPCQIHGKASACTCLLGDDPSVALEARIDVRLTGVGYLDIWNVLNLHLL